MIDLHLYAAFVAAVTVLMLIPGPNVALIVANSVAHGTRYGLLTVLGTSSAMVLQLAIAALGMTELLATLGSWFEWVRWIGVAYLVWLGVSYWRAAPVDLTKTAPEKKAPRAMIGRALLVSLSNPKTLLFYGTFFPQFLSGGPDLGLEIAVLSATFLALAVLVDGSWALLAVRARRFLATRGRLRNRLSGGLLLGAGVGLALARKS
jgi:threonine/homoserine/homoserine lactone efflux protein